VINDIGSCHLFSSLITSLFANLIVTVEVVRWNFGNSLTVKSSISTATNVSFVGFYKIMQILYLTFFCALSRLRKQIMGL
jgi:hypothetical protein